MQKSSTSSPMPARIQAVLDERVFEFALAAQAHYKTSDLVLVLDMTEAQPALDATPRLKMINATGIGERLRQKLAKPASEASVSIGSPHPSFWFFVIYEDGNSECVAVNATMLAPGGTA